MKSRHTLLAALGVLLLGGGVTMACTSPDRAYGTATGTTTSGTGGSGPSSTGSGATMSAGTGTTTMVPCVDPSDCPGKETECETRTCEGKLCGIGFSPAGKSLTSQFAGDCQKIVCDGQGAITQQVDDTDIPEDSNPCTQDVCTAGVPSHSTASFGTSCGGVLTCDDKGQCTGCVAPVDCPGADTDCQVRSCTSTVCGFTYKAAGTAVTMQTPADCKQNVCNGMGAVSVTFDGMDPKDDGNLCTIDGCSNGSPTHTNAPAGATCGLAKPQLVCNGGGECVECVTASSCKGQDDECSTRTCVAGSCGHVFAASGTPVALQSAGDCHKNVCDGSGGIAQAVDDTDVQQDGNVCTTDSCSGGQIVHAPVASGVDCGAPKTCDGTGSCVGCLSVGQCPGQDTECQQRTCTGGACGFSFTASGTPVAAQVAGDCKKNVCDGSGSVQGVADDADAASDGNECTLDQCSGGAPSYPPAPAGAVCSVGGSVCNGVGGCGVCTPGSSVNCPCGTKSSACCYNPVPPSSAVATQASVTDNPNVFCCCFDQIKDCDATGHWGACY